MREKDTLDERAKSDCLACGATICFVAAVSFFVILVIWLQCVINVNIQMRTHLEYIHMLCNNKIIIRTTVNRLFLQFISHNHLAFLLLGSLNEEEKNECDGAQSLAFGFRALERTNYNFIIWLVFTQVINSERQIKLSPPLFQCVCVQINCRLLKMKFDSVHSVVNPGSAYE